ncbi:ABC transporter permease [Saccharopolyspora erythraea]|uniref:ABC transporter permease n=1 Tax=Saccharopolyspora erythraea TaxID=1836 RepID=UPI001BA82F5B|nr:ABC transporter permease [Saccharopolyspora erythraea]
MRKPRACALLPATDTTKVVGLMSLPGAMTGLILATVDQPTAIRYQSVVMYMLLTATVASQLAQRTFVVQHCHAWTSDAQLSASGLADASGLLYCAEYTGSRPRRMSLSMPLTLA